MPRLDRAVADYDEATARIGCVWLLRVYEEARPALSYLCLYGACALKLRHLPRGFLSRPSIRRTRSELWCA